MEIKVLGIWGSPCDNRWDLEDASVLHNQYSCGIACSTTRKKNILEEEVFVFRDIGSVA